MSRYSFSLVVGLVALILYGSAIAIAQDRQSPIVFQVTCLESKRLTLAIQNVGIEDTAVIIGTILANGGKYLIDGLSLQTTAADGAAQYAYRPADYPAAVGGRIDDWIVPLPAHASYVMQATASQFVSEQGRRLTSWPNPSMLSLRLPVRTPREHQNFDVIGLKSFRVWKGTDALISNRITVPGQCS